MGDETESHIMFICTKEEQEESIQKFMLGYAMQTIGDMADFHREGLPVTPGKELNWIASMVSNALSALMVMAGEPIDIEADAARKQYMAIIMGCAGKAVYISKESGKFDDIPWIVKFHEEAAG